MPTSKRLHSRWHVDLVRVASALCRRDLCPGLR
ncbi:putative leader peptide [Streptomyces sp. NPDC049881]